MPRFYTPIKWFFLMFALYLVSCAPSSQDSSTIKAAPLTESERLIDFDTAVSYFKTYYAPLEFKERRFDLDFDSFASGLRSEVIAATSDQEFYDILQRLTGVMKDGHVSIRFPESVTYTVPFTVDYFEGRFFVVDVDSEFGKHTGISVRDELILIDGQNPGVTSSEIMKRSAFGYDLSDKRLAAFLLTKRRNFKPSSNQVVFKFIQQGTSNEYFVNTFWNEARNDALAEGKETFSLRKLVSNTELGIGKMGEETPFFMTSKVKEKTNFIDATISIDEWKAADKEFEPHNVFAKLYKHGDKQILMLRIPSYGIRPPTIDGVQLTFEQELARRVSTYELILKKYESFADVLVIDQTHNPGGSVSYVEQLASLFLNKRGPGFGFSPRADRLWLRGLNSWVGSEEISSVERKFWQNAYQEIDLAHERGDFLGPQIPLSSVSTTIEGKKAWTKPIVLLIDELCGSGGDAFPLIMKGNQAAVLYGHRTGGLGGNVEQLPVLTHSGATIRLTRSLFYLATEDGQIPGDDKQVENNGVTPDVERLYGIEDMNDGYTTYFKDFSDFAIEQADGDL